MKIVSVPPLISTTLLVACINAFTANVDFIRVPNGGIQPQAAVGSDGTLHLIYFTGDPAAGDLFYVRRTPNASEFSRPIQISQIPSSAVAMGTIRGAHMALGANDRIHVAWMGSGQTATKGKGKYPEAPMWFTRMNDAGTAFERERNVVQWTGGLDGGGSVAADSHGTVYVAWHGRAPDAVDGEAGRAMYLAVSTDGGKTFAREVQANPTSTGSCGCCGMRALVDSSDNLHLLFRTASPLSRDMMLLTSTNHARTFQETPINRWFTQSCPMSSSAMTDGPSGILVSTETTDQIEWTSVSATQLDPGKANRVSSGRAKHPSIARNDKGEIILAWAEGAGWAKGGALRWQQFGPNGERTDPAGGADLPTWSFPTAINWIGDGFVVVY